jgi:rhodanese-related sulfurtransferase
MIIVLGEPVLAASLAIQSATSDNELSGELIQINVGGLLIIHSIWWIYFDRPQDRLLTSKRSSSSGATCTSWCSHRWPRWVAGSRWRSIAPRGEVNWVLPGSIHFDQPEDLYSALDKDDEIIVYCSNVDCLSSVAVYRALVSRGYSNVRRYAGGLLEWEDSALPLEGSSLRPSGGSEI